MTTNPRRTYQVTCAECGEPFAGRRSDAKYCSESCQRRSSYKRNLGRKRAAVRGKTCLECGSGFTSKRSDAQFCSRPCNKRFYARENRQRINEWHRKWRQDHPDEAAAIRQRHQEKHGEQVRIRKHERYEAMKADPEQWQAYQQMQREWYEAHRDEVIHRVKERRQQDPFAHLYWKHGGTDWRTLFDGLWRAQDGCCYLCGDPLDRESYRRVHLDHSHLCCPLGRSCAKCRRGLACRDCNRLIGGVADDPDRLRRIADNLEAANADVARRMAEGG